MSVDRILEGLERRDPAALARAITLVENQRDGFERVLAYAHRRLRPDAGRRIGITGPPGAGKSTLVERLIQHFRARGLTVGVIAVDPTSAFSGGALLGDRIRMEAASLDPGVFIRSMATRGEQGGLATTTAEVADLLDAFGFDRILVETVGVGQTELEIARTADTTVLVLVPESGDGIQTLKAGVMEVADIYVINKADRAGAERLRQEVEVMLGLRRGNAFRHVAPHHRPERRAAVLRHQLGGADVRDEEGVGGRLARHRVGPGEPRIAQRRPLAAQAHRQAVALRGARQPGIDVARLRVAAGHRGDGEGGAQPVAEELGAQVGRREIGDRQRMVEQADVRPSGPRAARDVAARRQPEVLGLPLLDVVPPAARAPAHGDAASADRPRQRRIRSRWIPNWSRIFTTVWSTISSTVFGRW